MWRSSSSRRLRCRHRRRRRFVPTGLHYGSFTHASARPTTTMLAPCAQRMHVPCVRVCGTCGIEITTSVDHSDHPEHQHQPSTAPSQQHQQQQQEQHMRCLLHETSRPHFGNKRTRTAQRQTTPQTRTETESESAHVPHHTHVCV